MLRNFCRCNAAASDLYNGKSENKIAVVFFPNSHACLTKKTELIPKCCHPNKFMLLPHDFKD